MPASTKATGNSKAGATAPATDKTAEPPKGEEQPAALPSTGVTNLYSADGDVPRSAELTELLEKSGRAFPVESNPHGGESEGSAYCSSDEEEGSPTCSSSSSDGESHTDAVRGYLSPICAPKDYDNPNPGGPYECHPSRGRGSCIVVIDTGCTDSAFLREFSPVERNIALARLPPRILHGRGITSRPDLYIWDETMADEWECPEKPGGHGTQVAIIAAGSQSGVAPLANLVIYKVMSVIYEKLQTPSGPTKGDRLYRGAQPHAYLSALEDLSHRIARGQIPKGKTVVNMSFSWRVSELLRRCYAADPGLLDRFEQGFKDVLKKLAKQGVTMVALAGNDNIATVEEIIPGRLSAANDSIIIVGGSDYAGRLWWQSAPGTNNCPVHLYAQAFGVSMYHLQSTKVVYGSGASFAAPQVAGLAAYFLAHPDYQDRFRYSSHDYANSNTVGKRMRDFLVELAYQRVPADRLLHPDHLADYRYSPNAVVPPSVVVLYNGYHGDQKNRTD